MQQAHLWISGKKVTSAKILDVISPHSGEKMGQAHLPNPNQISQAIESAAEAQKSWGALPLKERTRVLFKFRELLVERQDEIAKIKSAESGKLINEAKAGLISL